MISPKLKKLLIPAYVLFLIFSFFYVRSVLEGVPVSEYDKDKKVVITPKEISVALNVSGPGITETYNLTPNDRDSVADLILKTKETYPEFTYDRTAYSYGYKFEHVSNVRSTENYEWRVYDGENDITKQMDSVTLSDKKTYLLQYTKID